LLTKGGNADGRLGRLFRPLEDGQGLPRPTQSAVRPLKHLAIHPSSG